ELAIDLLEGEHAPSRAVDPQHQRLHVLVDTRLADEPRRALTADGTGGLLTIEDLTRRDDHPDMRLAIGLELSLRVGVAHVVIEGHRFEGIVVVVLADERHDALLELETGLHRTHEPRLQGNARGVAARGRYALRERPDILRDRIGLELAGARHRVLVAAPQS